MSRFPSLFFVAALLAGCTVGNLSDVVLVIPISGGGSATVHFNKGAVVNAENDQVKIDKTYFDVESKAMTGRYKFGFLEKNREIPRHVTVQDVTDTDQPPVTWVDDAHPKLDSSGHWLGQSRMLSVTDKEMRWILEIDASVRIYKFTIEQRDGSSLVMYEPGLYPTGVKEFIRNQVQQANSAPAPSVNTR